MPSSDRPAAAGVARLHDSPQAEVGFDQRIPNETPQPHENKRQRTRTETPNIAELSRAIAALITADSGSGHSFSRWSLRHKAAG